MPDAFLTLSDDERRDILLTMATTLGRDARVLEKDVWVCFALESLWSTPSHPRMAFKGGTSLSKVYRAIERFSEDIDVTVDFRDLKPPFDPFTATTKSQLKKVSEHLKTALRTLIDSTVVPHLSARLAETHRDADHRIEALPDGESVRLHYRSVLGLLAEKGDTRYVRDSVLLEFGGRNLTEPSAAHIVAPDVAPAFAQLVFPHATVDVLAGERTFWEKATLMHVECNRVPFRTNAERLARHWYDLYRLLDHEIGAHALARRDILDDVVKTKMVFFDASYAHYDQCVSGGLRLVPDDVGIAALRADIEEMTKNGMFYGAVPVFDEIVTRLYSLEGEINGASLRG